MILTAGQEEALRAIKELSSNGKAGDVLIISGYAGTGKTTTLAMAANSMAGVTILAPTGKAALRVRETSGLPASTIHMWLYQPKENPRTGETEFSRKALTEIAVPASKIIMIDEASMVSSELWNDIYAVALPLDLKLVVFGDEFQLPPVTKKDEVAFNLLDIDTGKVRLTEITRQALESPIIRASMLVREGRMDEALDGLNIVVPSKRLNKVIETYQAQGNIICHRNVTRHKWNNQVRRELGREKELEVGEPLLVLKNNYVVNLFNGEVIKFEGWQKAPTYKLTVWDQWADTYSKMSFGMAEISGGYELKTPFCTLAVEEVMGEAGTVNVTAIAKTIRDNPIDAKTSHLHCNLGYVMTAHKSQGSEWAKGIVMIEDSVDIHSLGGRRWFYTSLTRFKEEVSVTYIA